MQSEAQDIHHRELAGLLDHEYGIPAATIHFLPKGEDSYVYQVDLEDGTRYFLRLQPNESSEASQRAYRAVSALHARGVSAALPPIAPRSGAHTCRHHGYTVSLFPYVDGETLYRSPRSDSDIRQAAHIIAAVHAQEPCAAYAELPHEGYGDAFGDTVQRCLQDALRPSEPAAGQTVEETRRLLATNAEDILETWQMVSAMGADLRRHTDDYRLTHGDPNYDNFLRGTNGVLHLTDWADIGWGPRERDLLAFTGDRFLLFLRAYAERSAPFTLQSERVLYYHYRWVVQEIADFGARILCQDVTEAEASHAWDELQPYVPVPHQEIAQSVTRIRKTAAEVCGMA